MRFVVAVMVVIVLIASGCGSADGREGADGDGGGDSSESTSTVAASPGDVETEEPLNVEEESSSSPGDPAEVEASIQALIADAEALGFTGVVSLPAADGGAASLAIGDVATSQRFDDPGEIVFAVGSLTKNFTAAALVLAAEQGLVDLEAPVGSVLESVPSDKQDLTIAQLLTHTSGLGVVADVAETEPIERDAMVERILNLPLVAGPGSAFNYSDAGYTLAAAILEAVTGTDHRTWINEQLLDPAGLTATGWIGTDDLGDRAIAAGTVRAETPSLGSLGTKTWGVLGAGGMFSTTNDLQSFIAALPGLLGDDGLERYTTAHWPDGTSEQGEGFGWVVLNFGPEERELSNTGGEDEVGHTVTMFWPRPSDQPMVIASASQSYPSERLLDGLIGIVIDGDSYQRDPVLATADPLSDAEINELTGDYVTSSGVALELTAQGRVFELRSTDTDGYRSLFAQPPDNETVAKAKARADGWLASNADELVEGSAPMVQHVTTGPVAGGEIRSWYTVEAADTGSSDDAGSSDEADSAEGEAEPTPLVELVVSQDGVLDHIEIPAALPAIRFVPVDGQELQVTTFRPDVVLVNRIEFDEDGAMTITMSDGSELVALRSS